MQNTGSKNLEWGQCITYLYCPIERQKFYKDGSSSKDGSRKKLKTNQAESIGLVRLQRKQLQSKIKT